MQPKLAPTAQSSDLILPARPVQSLGLPSTDDFRVLTFSQFDAQCRDTGCTILSRTELELLLEHGPFIELGAGNGYLKHCLETHARNLGQTIQIDSFDIAPAPKCWSSVDQGGVEAIAKFAKYRTLLLAWPPEEDDGRAGASMAKEALEIYLKNGGKKLIYIGDPKPAFIAPESKTTRESQKSLISMANQAFGEPKISQATIVSYSLVDYDLNSYLKVSPLIQIWGKD